MSESPVPVRQDRLRNPAGLGVEQPPEYRRHIQELTRAKEQQLLDALELTDELDDELGPVSDTELEALRIQWPAD